MFHDHWVNSMNKWLYIQILLRQDVCCNTESPSWPESHWSLACKGKKYFSCAWETKNPKKCKKNLCLFFFCLRWGFKTTQHSFQHFISRVSCINHSVSAKCNYIGYKRNLEYSAQWVARSFKIGADFGKSRSYPAPTLCPAKKSRFSIGDEYSNYPKKNRLLSKIMRILLNQSSVCAGWVLQHPNRSGKFTWRTTWETKVLNLQYFPLKDNPKR